MLKWCMNPAPIRGDKCVSCGDRVSARSTCVDATDASLHPRVDSGTNLVAVERTVFLAISQDTSMSDTISRCHSFSATFRLHWWSSLTICYPQSVPVTVSHRPSLYSWHKRCAYNLYNLKCRRNNIVELSSGQLFLTDFTWIRTINAGAEVGGTGHDKRAGWQRPWKATVRQWSCENQTMALIYWPDDAFAPPIIGIHLSPTRFDPPLQTYLRFICKCQGENEDDSVPKRSNEAFFRRGFGNSQGASVRRRLQLGTRIAYLRWFPKSGAILKPRNK